MEKVQEILKNHQLWLNGNGGERADLYGANLRYADLRGTDLRGVDLRGADLRGANLGYADLRGTDLRGVDLRGADLRGANLGYADLYGANFGYADLRGTDLGYADIRGANLSSADLRDADLRGANLGYADIRGANLSSADLRDADLRDVQYDASTAFFALQCPEEGSFVAWKKCRNKVIVKLLIPENAKRSSATSRKCRASKAIVLEVIGAEKGISENDALFVYEAGKEIIPDSFDDDRWNECSNGIHFFITRAEAESY